MKTKKQEISEKDIEFLAGLGIASISPCNISRKEIINIVRANKEFQEEARRFFLA